MKQWRRNALAIAGNGSRLSVASDRIGRVIARSTAVAFFGALFVLITAISGLGQDCYPQLTVSDAELDWCCNGSGHVNGFYNYTSMANGKPKYVNTYWSDDAIMYWDGSQWEIGVDESGFGAAYMDVCFTNSADTLEPPHDGWITTHPTYPDTDLVVRGQSTNQNPVFTATGPFDIDENAPDGTEVGDIDANDGDGGATDVGVTYSITAGNTDGAFAIEAVGGRITVANSAALDYETNWVFDLSVQVSDGCLTTTDTVTINLNDIPEVTWVGTNLTVITDARVGVLFRVTVDYDEPMDSNVSPTIEFDPLVGATLAFNTVSSGWTSDGYMATYDISDQNVTITGIDIAVSGGQNPAGITPPDYSKTDVFAIDTEAPDVAVTGITEDTGSSSTDGVTNDTTLFVNGTAEANCTVEVFRGTVSIGTTTADGSGEWSFYSTGGTVLGDGSYSFSATAEDAAGNTSEASSAFDVLIDTQAPPPPASDGRSPADGTYTNDRTPTFSWSEPVDPGDSGAAGYQIQIIDSDLHVVRDSYTSSSTYTVPSGGSLVDDTYTWKLATRDVAGNDSAWGDEWTLVVDASEPNVYLSSPSGGEYWAGGSSQTITWSAFDRPTSAPNFGPTPIDLHYTTDGGWNWVEIAIGEANDGNYTWSPIPTLNVTTLKVRATATDLAGNFDTSHHYDPLTIDSTIPETTGLDLPDGEQSVDENCAITITYSATVTDNICIDAGTVSVVVEFVSGAGTAVLNAPPATIANQGGSPNTQVNVSGSFTVSDLSAGDVTIRVRINAIDCVGYTAVEVSDTVTIGDSTVPVISGLDLPDTDQSVNEACTITIPYSATVTDNCCLDAGSASVVVEFVDPFNTATLTAPPALIINSGGGLPNDTVSVSGSFTVSDLTGSSVQVQVRINGTDCNGNVAVQASDVATITDSTAPVITWNIELPESPQYVDLALCTIALPIQATVTDNCCILAESVSVDISVTHATLMDAVTITQVGNAVVVAGLITVSNLSGCPAVLSVAINADDCHDNAATQLTDSVEIYDVTIPAINPVASNQTVECDRESNSGEFDTWLNSHGGASAMDNCGGVTWTNDFISLSDDCGETGSVLVTFTATDCCGHSSTTQAAFTIEDTTIPGINNLSFYTSDSHTIPTDEYTADGCGETTIYFAANITDQCCIVWENVIVNVTLPTDNAVLENIIVTRVQNGQGQVDIMGSADVRCLTNCQARVEVHIEATDCCGNAAVPVTSTDTEGLVYDVTAPQPVSDPVRFEDRRSWDNIRVQACDFGYYRLIIPMDTTVEIDVMHNDSDNCLSSNCRSTLGISKISRRPAHGIVRIVMDRASILYSPFPGYTGPDEFSYLVVDGCGNVSEEAAVLVEVISYPLMNDSYLLPCNETAFTFTVSAMDVGAKYADLAPTQPLFSILTPPLHGVLRANLGDVSLLLNESAGSDIVVAEISITYVPAVGFSGHDVMSLRVTDPLGNFDDAVIDIYLVRCTNPPAEMEPLLLDQGSTLELILPVSFVSVCEATHGNVVTLVLRASEENYASAALTLSVDEATGRHLLSVDTTVLPSGSYALTIPLGNGETVKMIIEVTASAVD